MNSGQWFVGVDDGHQLGPSPWLLRAEDGRLDTCTSLGAATDFGCFNDAEAARQEFVRLRHPDAGKNWTVLTDQKIQGG